jgi:hypothetical protein
MNASEIISALSRLGIMVQARGSNLALFPKSKVPASLVGEIREHKLEVIYLLLSGKARGAKPIDSYTVPEIQSLLGKDMAVGYYKPFGKDHPRIPLNGKGTTIREASGLCSPSCSHATSGSDSEVAHDDRD